MELIVIYDTLTLFQVIITVQQISRNSCTLAVERCFGMLVSPGRNVRHADMQLLERVTMATGANGDSSDALSSDPERAGGLSHVITGVWDPGETAFAVLNQETPPDIPSVYVTFAADLVVAQVCRVTLKYRPFSFT